MEFSIKDSEELIEFKIRYEKFKNGDKPNFKTRDLNILMDKVEELEKIVSEQNTVIYELDNERKKVDFEGRQRLSLEIENVKYYRKDVKKLENIIVKLKKESKEKDELLEKYKLEMEQLRKKAFIPKKKVQQITEQQIQEIKELRNDGLSYSEIESKTKWSKYTISKVLNGHYDKK